MSVTRCWCEGICSICEIGDVFNHTCNHCQVEYCPDCHGPINDYSGILDNCNCNEEYPIDE